MLQQQQLLSLGAVAVAFYWLGSVLGPSKPCTSGGRAEDLNGGLLAQQHLDDLATIKLLSKQVEMVQLSRRISAGPEPEPRPAPDLESPAGGGQTSCAHGHLFFGECMCDAGYRGIRCDDLYKPVLPCVDNPKNKNPVSLSPESGTDRCFQNEVYGRMVPPDGADRWKKAQKFETGLWATTGNSDDRVQTHIDGYSGFAGLGFSPVFGTLLEVGSGPFTQTKGVLASVPGAVVSNLTFFDPGMDVYLTKTARCSYKTGQLAKFPDGSGFWPYPVATTNTMPTTQYDTVIAFNVITHVQNGYEWLEGLYRTIKPGGLLMFSDYYFDGTDENFWYAPDAYYHPVRPFEAVYRHYFTLFDVIYEKLTPIPRDKRMGLTDVAGYWILRKK